MEDLIHILLRDVAHFFCLNDKEHEICPEGTNKGLETSWGAGCASTGHLPTPSVAGTCMFHNVKSLSFQKTVS